MSSFLPFYCTTLTDNVAYIEFNARSNKYSFKGLYQTIMVSHTQDFVVTTILNQEHLNSSNYVSELHICISFNFWSICFYQMSN